MVSTYLLFDYFVCFDFLSSYICPSENEMYLNEMVKYRILTRCAVSCKSEDAELAYWAVALLHEFAIHSKYSYNVETEIFRE